MTRDTQRDFDKIVKKMLAYNPKAAPPKPKRPKR